MLLQISVAQSCAHVHACYMASCKSECMIKLMCMLLQLGFLNIVGIPLFKAMAELFEGTQPMLDGVLANYRQWEEAAHSSDLPPK